MLCIIYTWLFSSSRHCMSNFLHISLVNLSLSDSFPEFLSPSRSPTYLLLSSYWVFSSLLKQSEAALEDEVKQRHIFTMNKRITPQHQSCRELWVLTRAYTLWPPVHCLIYIHCSGGLSWSLEFIILSGIIVHPESITNTIWMNSSTAISITKSL